jgi:hypothetical protein
MLIRRTRCAIGKAADDETGCDTVLGPSQKYRLTIIYVSYFNKFSIVNR